MLADEPPCPKRLDDRVEIRADPRDFRLRQPVEAQRLHEIVHLPRRHPVDVGFLHHRQQRLLGPAARLQQRREVGPRPDLRDRQVDGPDAGVPRADPRAIPVRRPILAALVALRADQRRDLRLHQRLGEHPDAFPQDIPILLFEQLANERRQIHPWFGHRHLPPCGVLFAQRTHGTMCDGRLPV